MADLIAHRGFAAVNPENTLSAFRGASQVADAVELDVRRCCSGELVVCHDATIDRVTDGAGQVADIPLHVLQDLDVLGSGEGIPTLDAVYDAVPVDCTMHVELKETGIASDVASVGAARPHETVVSSFLPEAIAAVRTATPELPRAITVGEVPDAPESWCTDVERGLDYARALGCAFLHPHYEACLADDGALVGRVHDAGLEINAWTVRDEAVASRLREIGVDGLIADLPV